MRPLDLLLLCDFPSQTGDTVRDHILALQRFSRHNVRIEKVFFANVSSFIDFSRFDGIIIHYTLVVSNDGYLSQTLKERLRSFRGLKAMFIQDEYRWVDRTIAAMREIGINLLFTCVPAPEIEKVYPATALPGVAKVNVLTGYVPAALITQAVPPFAERSIDIGYRGRKLPMWLGRLGQEKWQIARKVQADAARHGLTTNISFREEDRIYGENWIAFLTRCKAVLGVESGASVFDFTGELQRKVESHLAQHPDTTFEEIEKAYLSEHEGKVRLNQISPRCFEAAALRTLMILYEGEYSGILAPWRHYVPLKKDHSNMAEVVGTLRDPARAMQIIDCAFHEIALDKRYSFEQGVAEFDAAVDQRLEPAMMRTRRAYGSVEFRIARAGRFVMPDYVSAMWMAPQALPVRVTRCLVFSVCLGWLSAPARERVRRRIRRWRGIDAAKT